jgi:RNA polymerase primary sigma factor
LNQPGSTRADPAEAETRVDEGRLDAALIDHALSDLDDDFARTGVLCGDDDLNRAADRYELTISELAELRQLARKEGLVVTDRSPSPSVIGSEQLLPDDRPSADSFSSLRVLFRGLRQFPLLDAAGEIALARRIENGSRAKTLMSDKPEVPNRRELEAAVADGLEAKKRLVACNVRLAVANAKSYRGQGLDFDDLVQAAMPGLIRAAEKFDRRKGFKFSTYATWWIRQSIARALADTGRTIRLPVHVVEKLNKYRRMRSKLEARLGREPTAADLAAALEWDLGEVTALAESIPFTVSLDAPISRDGESLAIADLVASDAPSPYEETVDIVRNECLLRLVAELEPRQREIIELRHGLKSAPMTLDAVGRKLNVTRERIRQIEAESLKALRENGLMKGFPA